MSDYRPADYRCHIIGQFSANYRLLYKKLQKPSIFSFPFSFFLFSEKRNKFDRDSCTRMYMACILYVFLFCCLIINLCCLTCLTGYTSGIFEPSTGVVLDKCLPSKFKVVHTQTFLKFSLLISH